MREGLTALVGALGGAVLAVALVFLAAHQGMLPGNGGTAQIRSYLLAHPELMSQMSEKLQAQQEEAASVAAAAKLQKVGMKPFFDPKYAFVTGPANATKTVVQFYDFNCPFCRASLPALEKHMAKHAADTRYSFIEFPIKGDDSIVAARATLASRNQPDKYIALHIALMKESDLITPELLFADAKKVGLDMVKLRADMQKPEIDAAISASIELAHSVGIDGTPTFIINGVMHPGAVDDATLKKLAG